MSVLLSTIETIVRNIVEDFKRTDGNDIYTYDTSSVFTLSESNVIEVTDVFQNTTELGSGDWSFDSNNKQLTITASLSAGDTVEVRYSYYAMYSSTEIQNYVKAALNKLSINNYHTFIVENNTIYPEATEEEQHLIAAVTAILINPPRLALRTADLSMVYPRDLNTDEKIKRIIAYYKHTSEHGKFFLA